MHGRAGRALLRLLIGVHTCPTHSFILSTSGVFHMVKKGPHILGLLDKLRDINLYVSSLTGARLKPFDSFSHADRNKMALQEGETVLGIIGCGKMATAIIGAIFQSTENSRSPLKKVLASVRSPESQARLMTRFAKQGDAMEVLVGSNARVAKEADVVLLGHKPYMLDNVLGAEDLSDALRGKLIVSILAGISKQQIHEKLYGSGEKTQAFILLAVPNMGAQVQESMTVIAEPSPDIPSELVSQTTWLFEQAGKVKFVAPSLLNLSNILVAACIALTTVGIDGILDAAVMEGMPRSQAQELASQCLIATGKLLANGSHPAELRESISSPKGCTIRAIAQLEKLGARSAFTEAIKAGADHLKIMGSLQDPPR